MAATPADHPARATFLSNLGLALPARFERTGDLADLDAAIDVGRQAVAATPADHPDRARYLSNLGGALRIRFERTGDLADLDAAIDAGRQAVAATPADHPDRATYLSNLGRALRIRFERTGDRADLDAAIDALRQAVAVAVASPRVRAVAARGWGRAAAGGRRWQEAVAGFAAAAELLGLVAPRSLTRGDQEHLLEELGGLGADAAACCVHAGLTGPGGGTVRAGPGGTAGSGAGHPHRPDRPRRAGIPTWPPGSPSCVTTSTGPMTLPGLRRRCRRVWTGPHGRPRQAARRDMERRRAAAAAFDQVIAEIRQLPDFHGFLRPPPLAELLAAAAGGPVVIVTVSGFGSHALILTGGGVLDPVPLPGLTPEAVYDQVVAFLGALDDAWSPAAERVAGRRPSSGWVTRWAGCGMRSPARCSTGWASLARPGMASRGRGCGGACPGCCRSCRCTPPATTAPEPTPPRPP